MTAPVPIADRLVAPYALALRDCLRAELARANRGPVCKACVVWSQTQYTLDGCDCTCDLGEGVTGHGQAWVRWVDGVPPPPTVSNASGSRGVSSPCRTGWLITFEVGVSRCVKLSDDGSESPCDQLTADSLDSMSDAAALRRVLCCPALRDQTVIIIREVPLGRAGACVGVALTFQLRLTGA